MWFKSDTTPPVTTENTVAKIDVKTCLGNLQAFHDKPSFYAFEGSISSKPGADIGILPRDWEERLRRDAEGPDTRVSYTVMSYQTPIAWVVERRPDYVPVAVVIPDVLYSRTTSTAQRCCRLWLPFPRLHTGSL